MASFDTNAATEALIAQMIAEDFGEAHEDQLRPVGSHYGDYEEPLSSYERYRLEHPDIEDEEDDWDPPPPQVDSAEAEVSSTPLPEGASWDNSINEDSRIDSTPATQCSHQNTSTENWEGESIDQIDTTEDDSQTEIDPDMPSPTHHLHDPIHYHSPNTPTVQSPRHISQPTHEPRLPYTAAPPRPRNTTSPSQLESAIHHNYNYPQEPQSRGQIRVPYTEAPVVSPNTSSPLHFENNVYQHQHQNYPQEQQRRRQSRVSYTEAPMSHNVTFPPQVGTPTSDFSGHLPQAQVPSRQHLGLPEPSSPAAPRSTIPSKRPNSSQRLSDVFAPRPSLATNERLLPSHIDPDPELDPPIDFSSSKNKGKAPISRDPLIPSNSPSASTPRPDWRPHHRRRRDALNPTSRELDFDPDDGIAIHAETGLPFFKVPWMGDRRHLGPGEQAFAEMLENKVVDVRVGEEETVDGILGKMVRKEEWVRVL